MALALVNLVVAAILCGLIWTIQVVHYPLFARVPADGWTDYERAHQRAITPLVLPVMAANVLLGALLLAAGPAGADGLLVAVNAFLAAVMFAGTGLVYAPLHGRLAERWDAATHRVLLRLNWLRTAAWTLQTAVAVAIVTQVAAAS